MSPNAQRIAGELERLGYRPAPFNAPEEQGGGDGVKFEYKIEDGSRVGESVMLAVAMQENEGSWPEIAPHWIYIAPPDDVLAEQVQGSQHPGSVATYTFENGEVWLAISAPPSDFWDQIDSPGAKNMETYLQRHIRRIWSVR